MRVFSFNTWWWYLVHIRVRPLVTSVQLLSCVRLSATPWTAEHQASLSITNCRSLPKPTCIESVMPSNHLILCHPLLLLPSIFPSTTVFSKESTLRMRWPKSWSFSFSISPSNEYSGLISFRMDWLDLLAVQGTLKSLLHHHSSYLYKQFCLPNEYYFKIFLFLMIENRSFYWEYLFRYWTASTLVLCKITNLCV